MKRLFIGAAVLLAASAIADKAYNIYHALFLCTHSVSLPAEVPAVVSNELAGLVDNIRRSGEQTKRLIRRHWEKQGYDVEETSDGIWVTSGENEEKPVGLVLAAHFNSSDATGKLIDHASGISALLFLSGVARTKTDGKSIRFLAFDSRAPLEQTGKTVPPTAEGVLVLDSLMGGDNVSLSSAFKSRNFLDVMSSLLTERCAFKVVCSKSFGQNSPISAHGPPLWSSSVPVVFLAGGANRSPASIDNTYLGQVTVALEHLMFQF